jgi:hypothetical protein
MLFSSVINFHFFARLSFVQELHLVQDQLSIEQTRASKLEVGSNLEGSELMLWHFDYLSSQYLMPCYEWF